MQRAALDSADENQEKPDQQNRSQDAAWKVTPVGAVGISGQSAEEHQNQDDKYNCSKHVCILLNYRLRNVYSLEQALYHQKPAVFVEYLQNARLTDR